MSLKSLLAAGIIVAGTGAAIAQVTIVVPPGQGKSTVGTDAKNGWTFRVVNRNFGKDKITVLTSPFVGLVCDPPTVGGTTCHAWVKKGITIKTTLRRVTGTGQVIQAPGQMPLGDQWIGDCAGTTTDTCTTAMTKSRAVIVDWSFKP